MSRILDLEAIASSMAKAYGTAEIASALQVKPETVEAWKVGATQPTVKQLNALLDDDPSPFHAVQPLYEPLPEGKRLAILMATARAPHPKTVECILKMFENTKMVFKQHSFNSVYHTRDWLAHWFLTRTTCEWAMWIDDDEILPCGDAEWFKAQTENPNYPAAFAGANTIGQLVSRKKTLIGACYFGRRNGLPAQFAGASALRGTLANGPTNEVREAAWVGCGSQLVHRSVYEDIIKTQPEIRIEDETTAQRFGFRHYFYDPIEEGWNDDPSFCDRAARAGHKTYVDMSVMPAHCGERWYNYQHQQNAQP